MTLLMIVGYVVVGLLVLYLFVAKILGLRVINPNEVAVVVFVGDHDQDRNGVGTIMDGRGRVELIQGFQIDTNHWRHMFLMVSCIYGLAAAERIARASRVGASQATPTRPIGPRLANV